MSGTENQVNKRVERSNINENDMAFNASKERLDEQKQRAFDVTMQKESEEQGSKMFASTFRSTKSRKTYTKILKADFQKADWISKNADSRNTRKNINKTFKKITGAGWFGGLSMAEKEKRKKEFDSRRFLASRASKALADLAGEQDLGEDMSPEELINEMKTVDVGQFTFENDDVFVDNFTSRMKILQKAEMLLDYFRSPQGRKEMGSNMELVMNLYWMENVKKAYEERMTIVSSEYYMSMRDEDFTIRTKQKMKEQVDKGKADPFYKAYLSWQDRLDNEKFRGRRNYVFNNDKDQQIPYKKLKEKFYRELSENDDMMTGFNEAEEKSESGRLVERFFKKFEYEDSYGKTQTNLDGNYLQEKDAVRFVDLTSYPAWFRQDLYGNTDSNIVQLTKDEVVKATTKMQEKIDEMLTSDGKEKAKIRLAQSEKNELKRVRNTLDNIRNKVTEGKIGLDTARIWLDRTMDLVRGYAGNDDLHKGMTEQKPVRSKEFEEMTGKEREDYLAKEEAKKKEDLKKLGKTVYDYSKHLGSRGYVSLRGASDEDVRTRRYVHKDNLENVKLSDRNSFVDSNNLADDLDQVVDRLGEGTGSVIRMRGSKFRGESADPAYHVYITATADHKNDAVEVLLDYAASRNMLNHMHIAIRTGVDGFRNDDLTVMFSKDVDRKDVKAFLDGYSAKCKEKDADILTHNDEEMPVIAKKYSDGISVAPETSADKLTWVKELTSDLKEYDLKDGHLNDLTSKELEKRAKRQKTGGRPDHYNYHDFIMDHLAKSYVIAIDRLKNMEGVLGDVKLTIPKANNKMLKGEVKKVFKEFMILNGIDPETMSKEGMEGLI